VVSKFSIPEVADNEFNDQPYDKKYNQPNYFSILVERQELGLRRAAMLMLILLQDVPKSQA
jgi:hypothetical protein